MIKHSLQIQQILSQMFYTEYYFLGNSLYNNGDGNANNAYQGQVLLHPPYSLNQDIAGVSMGLVAIKQEGDGGLSWRSIKCNDYYNLDLTIPTTLCRQMGFTHVSEVMSRKDAVEIYGFNFSYWMQWL